MSNLLHFEDFHAGQVYDLGEHRVSPEEIIAYAREFDPQPQHLDAEAAKHSLLGGLAASGWQLCAIAMRMLYDGLLHRVASQGSPGVDEVQWRRPVLAGDSLRAWLEILETRESSKAERGFLRIQFSMLRGEERVMMYTSSIMVKRR
jgi:acyl dehydratase